MTKEQIVEKWNVTGLLVNLSGEKKTQTALELEEHAQFFLKNSATLTKTWLEDKIVEMRERGAFKPD